MDINNDKRVIDSSKQDNESKDASRKFNKDLLNTISEQLKLSLTTTFFVSTAIFASYYADKHLIYLMPWYLCMVAITAIRYFANYRYEQTEKKEQQIKQWKALFILVTGLGGLAWGMLPLVIYPFTDTTFFILAAIVLSGFSSAAAVVFPAMRLVAISFIVPALLPFILLLNISGEKVHYTLALIMSAYLIALLYTVLKRNKAAIKAFRLQHENERLIEGLSKAKEQVDITNENLRHEIQAKKQVEETLRENQAQIRLITDNIPALIAYIDCEQKLKFANYACEEWFSINKEHLMEKNIKDVLGEKAYKPFQEHFQRALKGKTVSYDTILYKKGNELRHVNLILVPHIVENAIKGFFTLFTDITARKENEERLSHIATHDVLTGLPNRLLFNERLTQAIARAARYKSIVGLLYLDLDGFKNINDTYGHEIGDKLLIQVVKRLQACLRDIDTIARLGGDEFTIVLQDLTSSQAASMVANRICNALKREFIIDGETLSITASVGISLYPQDGLEMKTLVKAADIAMYMAKEQGKNSYIFYNTRSQEDLTATTSLVTDIAEAINSSQMLIYYQPIFDIKTGKVVAAEALLRWKHPNYGLLMPVQFLNIAKQTGVIKKIYGWLIDKVLLQIKTWRSQGNANLKMAINISEFEFYDRNFIKTIESELAKHQMPGDCLEIELTENIIMVDYRRSTKIMDEIVKLGITLTLDDFNVEKTKINIFDELPIKSIKLDNTLMNNLSSINELINNLIVNAHTSNLKVVIEGIKNNEQLNYFKQKYCDNYQGYIASSPLPADMFFKFLSQ